MPPKKAKGKLKKGKGKKKGKGGKKKAKGKKSSGADPLTSIERYQRAVTEISSLKEQLTVRSEMAREAKMACQRLRAEVHDMVEDLEAEESDKRQLTSDLTRQYKSMQLHLGMKIQQGEAGINQLQRQLAETQAHLQEVTKEKELLLRQNHELQEELREQAATMEHQYEEILLEAVDSLTSNIDKLHKDWHKEAIAGSRRMHQILMEFAHDGDSLDEKCRNLYRSQTSTQANFMDDLGDYDSDTLTDKMEGLSVTSGQTDDSLE